MKKKLIGIAMLAADFVAGFPLWSCAGAIALAGLPLSALVWRAAGYTMDSGGAGAYATASVFVASAFLIALTAIVGAACLLAHCTAVCEEWITCAARRVEQACGRWLASAQAAEEADDMQYAKSPGLARKRKLFLGLLKPDDRELVESLPAMDIVIRTLVGTEGPKKVLSRLFTWSVSVKGHDYWKEVHDGLPETWKQAEKEAGGAGKAGACAAPKRRGRPRKGKAIARKAVR